ncbi:BH3 interacting domain death agonist isoform 2-T4 [Salvelinus alpinus]|uniref:BH3 interacting domain death agonist isoform X2 n=1 Tax=Salvelinus alpinus TaxID=8036 RepID=UPI0039FC8766
MDCGDVQCTPLVFLTFLQQQSCSSAELRIELDSLARELKLTQDINGNGLGLNNHEEGELQTDGHFCSSSRILLEGLEPQAALAWPDNPADEEALRGVAAGLIEIADQLERSVMAQAAENLTKKLQKYSIGRIWQYIQPSQTTCNHASPGSHLASSWDRLRPATWTADETEAYFCQ